MLVDFTFKRQQSKAEMGLAREGFLEEVEDKALEGGGLGGGEETPSWVGEGGTRSLRVGKGQKEWVVPSDASPLS